MKKVMTKSIIFLIIGLAFNIIPVFGGNVKLLEKIEISKEFEPIGNPWAFCITQDELFMIPDYKAGNIKIYENAYENDNKFLRQVKIIGSKGYGPGELQKPTFCFYSKDENKFVVMDHGIRKIFIYDRIGRLDFKRVEEILCLRGADDIQLLGNSVFISGYNFDLNRNHYDFYYFDLTTDKKKFLLPSYHKYGFKSSRDFETLYNEKHIPVIGIRGWFDIHRDYAYFVWEGNLKIIKLNIVSGGIKSNPFGMKPSHYIRPFVSENLRNGYRERNQNIIRNEKAKMSYVRNIFTSSKYVLIIYEGPIKTDSVSNFRLQFYTLDGDFIKEVPIPGKPNHKMWFDNDREILYSLCRDSNNAREYYILKYKIHE